MENNINIRKYLILVRILINQEWKGGTPNLKINATLVSTSTHAKLLATRAAVIKTKDASL